MMSEDLKPLPVKGYTDQSADKVALVNRFKEIEERVLREIDALGPPPGKHFFIAPDGRAHTRPYDLDSPEAEAATLAADQRWLAIARTHTQEAFMALNRAVFQPQRIKLPEDGE